MEYFRELNPLFLWKIKDRAAAEDFLLLFYYIVVIFLLYNIFLFLLDRLKPTEETADLYNRRRLARLFFFGFGFLFLLPEIFSKFEYLPTVLGLAGAGIVITMKDYLLNFVGWFLIHGSNGFEIGDRVEIDGVKGDVVNIGINRFTLMEVSQQYHADQSTNRLVHFPNHWVIVHRVFVVSQRMTYVWDEIQLFLTFDSNWEVAEEVCNRVLQSESIVNQREIQLRVKEMAKRYMLKMGVTTPIVYLTIEEGNLVCTLRYMTSTKDKRRTRTLISKQILREFQKHPEIQLTHFIR